MDENEEKNGLMRLIIIAVSIVIVLSIIGFVMVKFINPNNVEMNIAGAKQEKEKVEEIGPTYELGDFTVNFAEENNYQFLKASIVFELSHNKLKEELNSRNQQIRDLTISILRSQTPEDIKSPSTDMIKKEIKTKVNDRLNTGEIKNVWFTQLVIQ